jgi:hypothetical protein
VQYKLKVAEVQKDDEQTLNQLNAEMTVLTQMAQDLTAKLNLNAASIDELKSVFEARENQLKMYRLFAYLAIGLCYFMPSFGMGFIYVVVCLFVAFYLTSQANDQLAYSEGYTVQEWKSKKETISALNKQKAQDREALAKSISEHLKK